MAEDTENIVVTEEDRIRFAIQALKNSPGWLYIQKIIAGWKEQALADVLAKKDVEMEKGEFQAYARMLKLPDAILEEQGNNVPVNNLDAYK